jgi:outer membrane usher protein FimD/PapC
MSSIIASEVIPEGFEGVTTEEMSDLQVYYHDQYLGKAVATFDDDFIQFDDLKVLDKMLSMVDQKETVLKHLHGRLDPHVDYACREHRYRQCKALNPKIVGVVLNRDAYQVNLFINYDYLKPASQSQLHYYQPLHSPLGLISQYQLYLSGSQDALRWSLNQALVLSKANQNVSIDGTLSGSRISGDVEQAFRIYGAKYTQHWQRHETNVGLLSTDGLLMLPTIPVLGAQVKTDHSFMVNEHVNYGTPIEVNLTTPSTVEVLKEGKTIYSEYFQAGNFFLDTKRFPVGVYQITIRITTMNNQVRTYEQLYTKNLGLPAFGYPEYSITVGMLSKGFQGDHAVLPQIDHHIIVQTNYEKRLTDHSAIQLGGIFDKSFGLVTLGWPWLGEVGDLNPSLAIDTEGDFGAGVSYNWNYKRFGINLLSRHFFARSQNNQTPYEIDSLTSNSSVDSATVTYNGSGHFISANASYESQSSGTKYRKIGVSWRKQLLKKNGWTLNANLSANRVNDQNNYKAYLNLAWSHGKIQQSMSGNYRFTQDDTNDTSWYGNYQLTYTPNRTYRWSTQYSVGDQQQSLRASVSANYDLGHVSANYYRTPDQNTYNYQLSFDEFGFVWANSKLVFSSSMPETSGVIFHIQSPDDHGKFDVAVNGHSYILAPNQSKFISLPSLTDHQVSVTSIGEKNYEIEQVMPFLFYPNTLTTYDLTAQRFYTLMGTFQYPDGRLVKKALIDGGLIFASTDDEGHSDVDVREGTTLTLTTKDGSTCQVDTKLYHPVDGLAYEDSILCAPTA